MSDLVGKDVALMPLNIILTMLGNTRHSKGGGYNTAAMYGEMLDDIRDICSEKKQAIEAISTIDNVKQKNSDEEEYDVRWLELSGHPYIIDKRNNKICCLATSDIPYSEQISTAHRICNLLNLYGLEDKGPQS